MASLIFIKLAKRPSSSRLSTQLSACRPSGMRRPLLESSKTSFTSSAACFQSARGEHFQVKPRACVQMRGEWKAVPKTSRQIGSAGPPRAAPCHGVALLNRLGGRGRWALQGAAEMAGLEEQMEEGVSWVCFFPFKDPVGADVAESYHVCFA